VDSGGQLPGRGVKDGDEGKQQHIPEQGVPSAPLPQVKHFEENRVGGVRPVAVAPARAQMGSQRGNGRITGQQGIGQSNACVLFLAPRFA
jgi:hypothetical protein